jgi:hypothetical protein
MALKNQYFFPDGIIRRERVKTLLGHTSFTKILSKILNSINVPFADPCCTAMGDSAPVRYNTTDEVMEYHNGTEWVAVPSAALNPV